MRLIAVFVAAWIIGCCAVYYIVQPYGLYVSRADRQNFLWWSSIPSVIIVVVVLGIHLAIVSKSGLETSNEDLEILVRAQSEGCINQIMEPWVYYNKTLKFKPDVPLSEVIIGFALPMGEFVRKAYPSLYAVGPTLFWTMLFRGVQKSGIPSPEAIKDAITELRSKKRKDPA